MTHNSHGCRFKHDGTNIWQGQPLAVSQHVKVMEKSGQGMNALALQQFIHIRDNPGPRDLSPARQHTSIHESAASDLNHFPLGLTSPRFHHLNTSTRGIKLLKWEPLVLRPHANHSNSPPLKERQKQHTPASQRRGRKPLWVHHLERYLQRKVTTGSGRCPLHPRPPLM